MKLRPFGHLKILKSKLKLVGILALNHKFKPTNWIKSWNAQKYSKIVAIDMRRFSQGVLSVKFETNADVLNRFEQKFEFCSILRHQ
jgi:uncharacterized protein YecA (UPF0149 family)